MTGQTYVISDASKLLAVEPHVLRNWEYELKLKIQRNELGHRFYTEENISILMMVKKLKEHGFTLKHIKLLLPSLPKLHNLSSRDLYSLRDKLNLCYSSVTDLPDTPPTNVQDNRKKIHNGQAAPVIAFDSVKSDYQKPSVQSASPLTSLDSRKKEILYSMFKDIIVEVLNDNYERIKKDLISSISTNIAKEFNYYMIQHESKEDEHFQSLGDSLTKMQKKRFKKEYVVRG